MGPKRQIKTMKFIATTVGKPIGVLAQAETPEAKDGEPKKGFLDGDAKVIGLFIQEALTSLDDEAIISQIEILLAFAELRNDQGNFVNVTMEKDFHGELQHMFHVVKVILEVNFGSFLGVSTGLLAKFKGRFAKENDRSSQALQ